MTSNWKEVGVLLIGDFIVFLFSLWFTLVLRYAAIPPKSVFYTNFWPFLMLFGVWIMVFFIAGLYEKHTLILQKRLPSLLFYTQIINSTLAVAFFYFIPYLLITPKTILFIYLAVSFALLFVWRVRAFPRINVQAKEKALLIGNGDEARELMDEVNENPRYGWKFVDLISPESRSGDELYREVLDVVERENVRAIVLDPRAPEIEAQLPKLYELVFSKVRLIDMYSMYEDIFDRVPLSLIDHAWFIENISRAPHYIYDVLKRGMDLFGGLFLFVLSLPLYVIVFILIKIDDGGPVFFSHERIGENNKAILIRKFRTLSVHDEHDGLAKNVEVTRVGSFLRKSRIDELPQLLGVVSGSLSLIGPRPEIPTLVKEYEEGIPYYSIRHLIKPGLSGWAQLYHQDPPKWQADSGRTKTKLSYDLYYIKNRSFFLDVKIALKTLKKLISRSGT